MLTDPSVKNAQPKDKPYKLADGAGLFILVHPNGGKYWRLKYRIGGKEKQLALGVYPEVGLKQARVMRDAARAEIHQGIDPSAERKKAKRKAVSDIQHTLSAVASRWMTRKVIYKSESSQALTRRILSRDLLPELGDRPIDSITRRDLVAALHRIEEHGPAIAKEAATIISLLFQFAVDSGVIEMSPAHKLRSALSGGHSVKHFAAATTPEALANVMRKIDAYDTGWVPTRVAIQILPRVFCRPSELLTSRWEDIDLESGTWLIRRSKTKESDTLTLLPTQVLALFKSLLPISGHRDLVFPAERGGGIKSVERDNLSLALRAAGIAQEEQSPHGFRATARTLLDEVLHQRVDLIEAQLGHRVISATGRAYNRTSFVEERGAMLQLWSDFLDGLRDGNSNVVTFKKVAG
ncbi:MAG: hypothetical protein RLZZ09_3306 [Pseudomonadota bacterium]|jgi:integrase